MSLIERKNLSEDEEKKKREALFNKRKRKYEKALRCKLCDTFEDKEEQIEKFSKLLLYTYNLYKFTDYINKSVNTGRVGNEGFLIQKKYLDLLILILIKILKKY